MNEERRTAQEIIPVIEEQVVIGTERVTTGTVRLRRVTHEDEHAIDEPVTITDVEVKRVPVDLWTDEPVADRGTRASSRCIGKRSSCSAVCT